MSQSNPVPSAAADQPAPDATTIARLVISYLLTVGALPLGLGYSLVFYVLEGRTPRSIYWFLPAVFLVILLTWGLGRRRSVRPWSRTIVVLLIVGWVVATAVLGMFMTSAAQNHGIFIALYAVSTLWMPFLAWFGYWPMTLVSKTAALVALGATIFGFHQIVEVVGLSGGAIVQLDWRNRAPSVSLAANPTKSGLATISLEPTPYDFSQFLGPNRNAVIDGVEIDPNWIERPPQKMWRQPIGKGWGAFAIVGDVAFTLEQRQDQECVVCYDLRTGKTLWLHADEQAFESTFGGDGPRSTPVVADGRVYSVGATGVVHCLDGKTGEVVWTKRILEKSDANLSHGVCGSPLVVGDLVYVCPVTYDDQSLQALNRATGEVVFTAGGARAAYSSPVLVTLDGVPQILAYTGNGLFAHDPTTGDILWSHPWGNDQFVNASQPVVYRDEVDQVFLSTAYGKGSTLINVSRSADGKWKTVPRWETNKMKNKFSTSVLFGDVAVGLDDGILAGIDLKTGRQTWKKGRYGHGQILKVGSRVVVLSEKGQLFLLDIDKSGPKELAPPMQAIEGKTWNHLAFSPPFLLVRNSEEAACYKLPIEGENQPAGSTTKEESPAPKEPLTEGFAPPRFDDPEPAADIPTQQPTSDDPLPDVPLPPAINP